ncbi:4304_t:CDS:2 [Ambispora leptoticha]|uniref:Regulatory protein SIR2 homolog 7 n=1 Tax=Ambispora leptoticha TaxID=144679 RepID=A0A9N9G1A8_9GLOM|nr:4304_t:CDS:2 [Ambispora leptoticha]
MHLGTKVINKKKEDFDSPEMLQQKTNKLMELIRKAKFVVVFIGIDSFVSKHEGNTITKSQQPTKGQKVLVRLFELGYIKYIVSQTIDGTLIRYGMPLTAICELNGNVNIERCPECKRSYWRKFNILEENGCEGFRNNNHQTCRRCYNCGYFLRDTIIYPNESIPNESIQKAAIHTRQCDLLIILGTLSTMNPIKDLFSRPSENLSTIIINTQKSPQDINPFTLRLFSRPDDVLLLISRYFKISDLDKLKDLVSNDDSFLEMIILPNPTRKLDAIRETRIELRKWSIEKLNEVLKERGVVLHTSVDKNELVEIFLRRCGDIVYWI